MGDAEPVATLLLRAGDAAGGAPPHADRVEALLRARVEHLRVDDDPERAPERWAGERLGLVVVGVRDPAAAAAVCARLGGAAQILVLAERAADLERVLRAGATDFLLAGEDDAAASARIDAALARAARDAAARRAIARAEAELRASEDRYRTVARATNDAVYDWDIETGRLTWNDGIQTLFGYAPEDVTPDIHWWDDKLHPDDRARVVAGLRSLVGSDKEIWSDEYRYRRVDGSYAHVFDRGIVLRDAAGKGTRMIGAMMDTTELKQAQARLVLAGRMASVGTLAAGVAHEINNPLAFVIANLDAVIRRLGRADHEARAGAAGALLGAGEVGELLHLLEDAREGAERVRLIVRDLKTFSRAEEDRRGPVDVARVLESCVQMAMNEIRHRARVVRDYAEVPPVEANESRLAQVFLNLIVNAAQAIPEGAADRNEIGLSTRTDAAGRVVVEVRDTGTGIAPDALERIFDPFYTSKAIGEGLGLGLAICHGIVTALGGTIGVESALGSGSVFRVTLPAAPGAARSAGGAPAPGPPAAAPRRARVLIIDDEPMLARAIAGTLEPDHAAETTSSARDALARIRAGERFDVILCDLMMPEMTGMDLYEALAEVAPDQRARMVFLTGGAFTERARLFLEKVGSRLLVKPFEAAVLHGIVQEVLAAEGVRAR